MMTVLAMMTRINWVRDVTGGTRQDGLPASVWKCSRSRFLTLIIIHDGRFVLCAARLDELAPGKKASVKE